MPWCSEIGNLPFAALPYTLVITVMFWVIGRTHDNAMEKARRGVPPPDHDSRPRDLGPLFLLTAVLAVSLVVCRILFGPGASVSVMIILPLLSVVWIGISAPEGIEIIRVRGFAPGGNDIIEADPGLNLDHERGLPCRPAEG